MHNKNQRDYDGIGKAQEKTFSRTIGHSEFFLGRLRLAIVIALIVVFGFHHFPVVSVKHINRNNYIQLSYIT